MRFHFQTCTNLPLSYGGRGMLYGGGLLLMKGEEVVWGRGGAGGGKVYRLNQAESGGRWNEMIRGGLEYGTKLAMWGEQLVAIGGLKGAGVVQYLKNVVSLNEGKWTHMSELLVGCAEPCVVGVGGGGLIVMGGQGLHGRSLDVVQVFDGGTHTWHYGPSLPLKCYGMSAVIHGDLVIVMGGVGMDRVVWYAYISELVSRCFVLMTSHFLNQPNACSVIFLILLV